MSKKIVDSEVCRFIQNNRDVFLETEFLLGSAQMNSIHLHCTVVEAQYSETNILNPGWIKTKCVHIASADTKRDEKKFLRWINLLKTLVREHSSVFSSYTWHSNITTSYLARVDHERVDSRLYKSGHNQKALFFNTCIHSAQQQAAVCMLNHSSQLKSLLSGSKLPDSDLLLTSNPNPDKPLSTTFQSAFLHSPIHQNEGSVAFIFFMYLLV